MAEPTTIAMAATGTATSTLAVVALTLGVPAPVVLASVIGAAAAVMQAERTALTLWAVTSLVVTFAVAVGLGIWGCGPAGHALMGLLSAALGHVGGKLDMPSDSADALAAVLLAMLGQSKLLPLVLRLLDKRAGGAQ